MALPEYELPEPDEEPIAPSLPQTIEEGLKLYSPEAQQMLLGFRGKVSDIVGKKLRKNGDLVMEHLDRAALFMMQCGFLEPTLLNPVYPAAAWGHDLVEDYSELFVNVDIQTFFMEAAGPQYGVEIASYIGLLSKDPTKPDSEYFATMDQNPLPIQMIKAGENIHNTATRKGLKGKKRTDFIDEVTNVYLPMWERNIRPDYPKIYDELIRPGYMAAIRYELI